LAGRILVTGASGFIGRRLLPALTRGGYSILAPVRAPQPSQDGVEFSPLESIETIDWRPLLAGVDAVVHLAAIAHTRDVLAAEIYDRINAQAALRLAGFCAGRVARFVFVSSIRAISGPTSHEILDDESAARPTDAYGRSKLKAERGLASLNLPASMLRPVVVYGAGAKGNLARIARLADTPLPLPFGALRAARSFLSLDNFVSAILFALAQTGGGATSLAVADPEPSSVADLLAGLRAGLGRPSRLWRVPPGLLGVAAQMAGQAENWALLSGPLAVRPGRLLEAGWSPPVALSSEGARLWGESLRGR
jgi:UDP-glucose 4-epimerase